jgi:hypothetical protein
VKEGGVEGVAGFMWQWWWRVEAGKAPSWWVFNQHVSMVKTLEIDGPVSRAHF